MADETETPEVTESAAPEAAAAPAEPKEIVHPKVARKLSRSTHAGGKPAAAQTAEERHAARVELRKANALARSRRRKQESAKAVPSGLPGTPKPEHGEGRKLLRTGTVTSAKPDKTITVRIDVARRHRKYSKIVRSSSKIHVHDETNDANEGDVVRVIESRPLSALKRWKLVEIVERAR
jgi:small subunit ribosomal protein S17